MRSSAGVHRSQLGGPCDSAREEGGVNRSGAGRKCRERMEEHALLPFFPVEKLGGALEYSSH